MKIVNKMFELLPYLTFSYITSFFVLSLRNIFKQSDDGDKLFISNNFF